MNYILLPCWQTEVTVRSLCSGLKKKRLEQLKKRALFGLHLWVCIHLSLLKVKTERRSSPVWHHRALGHCRWLHVRSSRPRRAFKKNLAWSRRWMCVGLTCANTHGADAAGQCSASCRRPSLFPWVCFFSACFHPSACAEDRSHDALICTYMI